MKRWNVVLVLVAMALVARCGGDSGGGGSGATADPDEGKPAVTKAITAADGGTISTASGNATLNISKNALPADTEISVAVEAATADTETSIYDFGPDGLEFLVPVELEIKYDGTPGDNEKAALAWYDEAASKWVEVENSSLHEGVVKGKITHFSKFTIILVAGEIVLQSECSEVADNFSPCGGDLVGTWKFKDICTGDQSLGGNPYAAVCEGANMAVEMTWDATITFNADGTFTSDFKKMTQSATLTIPTSCMGMVGKTCDATMAEDDWDACATQGDDCVCEKNETSTGGDGLGDGTYVIEGNTLSTNGDSANNYCRQGDLVTVEIVQSAGTDENGNPRTVKMYYVVEKQ